MLQQPPSPKEIPPTPQILLQFLLYNDFSASYCIQPLAEGKSDFIEKKMGIKQQINEMQKSKREYMSLLQKKRRLKAQLKQLLTYRQSIEYDHKYKSTKFDNFQFPYTDNLNIKEQLNRQRLNNLQKKRKIKELQEEVKRKQRQIELKRIQKQNLAFAAFRDHQVPQKNKNREEEEFWLSRIENIKNRYLSQDEEYKRAKIRHDYNQFVQRQCKCKSQKSCTICSNLNFQEKTSYIKEVLLSPRYRSIYGSRF